MKEKVYVGVDISKEQLDVAISSTGEQRNVSMILRQVKKGIREQWPTMSLTAC